MTEDRLNAGPVLVAAGSALLAVSVFLPWFGFTLTASGASAAQQGLNNAAQEFGNSTFQSAARNIGNSFDTIVGRQVATLSAHQALKVINLVLLAVAAIAFVAALLRLAAPSTSAPARGLVALVGAMAALCILYRMASPPTPEDAVLSVSLSWGIWVALGSSLAIVVGDLWPRPSSATRRDFSPLTRTKDWLGLSETLGP